MEWLLGITANLLGVLTPILAAGAWVASSRLRQEAQKREDLANAPIDIIMVDEESGELFRLPYRPLRRLLNRAELQGIIGMYYGPGRYNIPAFEELFSSQTFDKMVNGEINSLSITCPPEVFNTFKTRQG